MFSKEIIESIKSFIRVILMAVIPVVISSLQAGEINWTTTFAAVGTAALFAVQDWLHQSDVKTPLDMKNGVLDDLKGKK